MNTGYGTIDNTGYGTTEYRIWNYRIQDRELENTGYGTREYRIKK